MNRLTNARPAGLLGLAALAGFVSLAVFPLTPVVLGADGTTSDGGPAHVTDPSRMPADVAMDLDFLIASAWKGEDLEPTDICSDEEYVRRVFLDVVGAVPTPVQARAFVVDKTPTKRADLVARLVETPGYARHMTNRWSEVLVGQGTGENAREFVPAKFQRWLEEKFIADRPYAEIVTEIVTATGTVYASGPVNYSGRRNHGATDLAGATSKHFLGVQIQCAQCHDHPYEDIRQADFNGMAAFFTKMDGKRELIDYTLLGERAVKNAKQRYDRIVKQAIDSGKTEVEAKKLADRQRQRSLSVGDLELIKDMRRARGNAARRKKQLGELANVTPKFLNADVYVDGTVPTRRAALAGWIVDPANPYTARALANRYWGWFLGKGFVSPVDDFSSVNIPSIPAALDVLTQDTADHRFDLKRLVKIITATRAYQLSTATPDRTPLAEEFFSAGPLKPMSPQQTFDSLQLALGVQNDALAMSGVAGDAPSAIEMEGRYGGMMGMNGDELSRAERLLRGAARSFFQTFDDDEGGDAAAFTGTVPQGLFLLNSRVVNDLLVSPNVSVVRGVLQELDGEPARVRHLYQRTLSREPTNSELAAAVRFVKNADAVSEAVPEAPPGAKKKRKKSKKDQRRRRTAETRREAAYADLLWALISSSEFNTNH